MLDKPRHPPIPRHFAHVTILLLLLLVAALSWAFYVPTMNQLFLPNAMAAPAVSGWPSGTTCVLQALALNNSGATVVVRFYYAPGDQGMILGFMGGNPFVMTSGGWTPMIYTLGSTLFVGEYADQTYDVSYSLSAGWHTVAVAEYYSSGTYYVLASLDGGPWQIIYRGTTITQLFGMVPSVCTVGWGKWTWWPGAPPGVYSYYTDEIAWVALYPGYQPSLAGAWELPPPGAKYIFTPMYTPVSAPSTSLPIAIPTLSHAYLPGGLWYALKWTTSPGMYYNGVACTGATVCSGSGQWYVSAPISSTTGSSASSPASSSGNPSAAAVAAFFYLPGVWPSVNVTLTGTFGNAGGYSGTTTMSASLYCRAVMPVGSMDYTSSNTASASVGATTGSVSVQTSVTFTFGGALVACVGLVSQSGVSLTAQATISVSAQPYLPSALPDKYGIYIYPTYGNLTARFVGFSELRLYNAPTAQSPFYNGYNNAYSTSSLTINGTAWTLGFPANASNYYVVATAGPMYYVAFSTSATTPMPNSITVYQYWPNSTGGLSSSSTTYAAGSIVQLPYNSPCYLPASPLTYYILYTSQPSYVPSPACMRPDQYFAQFPGYLWLYFPSADSLAVYSQDGSHQYGSISVPAGGIVLTPSSGLLLNPGSYMDPQTLAKAKNCWVVPSSYSAITVYLTASLASASWNGPVSILIYGYPPNYQCPQFIGGGYASVPTNFIAGTVPAVIYVANTGIYTIYVWNKLTGLTLNQTGNVFSGMSIVLVTTSAIVATLSLPTVTGSGYVNPIYRIYNQPVDPAYLLVYFAASLGAAYYLYRRTGDEGGIMFSAVFDALFLAVFIYLAVNVAPTWGQYAGVAAMAIAVKLGIASMQRRNQ